MFKRILKHFLEFFIRTLSVYSLYIGLKLFYNVSVGLEWIGFIILVGIAQSITERSAIEKDRRKFLRRIKNSDILEPGDEFMFPVCIKDKGPRKTLLTLIKKDYNFVYVRTNKGEKITIPIHDFNIEHNIDFL